MEAEIGEYTASHMKFVRDAENNYNKMFPDTITAPPPEPTTTVSLIKDNIYKYINRPDLMAKCASIAADCSYTEYLEFLENLKLSVPIHLLLIDTLITQQN